MATPILDTLVEDVVRGVEHGDVLDTVLLGPCAERVAQVLRGRCGGDQRHGLDAHLVEEVLEDERLRDHADAAGDAGRFGEDVIGGARDVVAARGRDAAVA